MNRYWLVIGILGAVLAADVVAQDKPVARPSNGVGEKPPKFALELKDGTRAIGVLDQLATLPLEVGFGVANVPLDQIASVEFTADGKTTKVKFKNGDTLTGSAKLAQVKLDTPHGGMNIPLAALTHLTAGGKFPSRGDEAAASSTTGTGARGVPRRAILSGFSGPGGSGIGAVPFDGGIMEDAVIRGLIER